MANDEACLIDLGLLNYEEAWAFQKQVWELRVQERIPDTLILVEHPPVITLGKSGKTANLLLPEAELQSRGVGIFRVERGGDVTYHGPGQLVGYPIFRLAGALAGVRRFVENMELSLIQTLGAWGIAATMKPGLTGVWKDDRKIAAIGVAVRRQVTFHGFALNVNPDLTPFSYIVPCGIRDMGVTSMARELGRQVSMPAVKHQVVATFEGVFDKDFRLICKGCVRQSLVLGPSSVPGS
jgi:lipoyl(octanoyl) transferase